MSESILEEAQRLIHGDRNKNYGHPRENFADTAALFSGYLGKEISDIDVANLMILLKVARVKGTGYHRDSFTDIAGYAGCVERIYEEPVVKQGGELKIDLDIPPVYLNWMRKLLGMPQIWDRLQNIPVGTTVTDKEGDFWKKYSDDEIQLWFASEGEAEADRTNPNNWDYDNEKNGPFTEVLPPRKWDNVADIPFGVRFKSILDGGGWKQVDEDSYRYYWSVTGEEAGDSSWRRWEIQHYAPFIEVLPE